MQKKLSALTNDDDVNDDEDFLLYKDSVQDEERERDNDDDIDDSEKSSD